MSLPVRSDKKETLITVDNIRLIKVDDLPIQQRAPIILYRLIREDRTDIVHAVRDVAEERAAAAAGVELPHRHGQAGERALGECGGRGEGLRPAPVRGVGVGGEGEAAAREGSRVGGDRAVWVDSPGGEDGEGVGCGGGRGGESTENGEEEEKRVAEHREGMCVNEEVECAREKDE